MFERAGYTTMGVGEPLIAHEKEKKLRWCHLHIPEKRDQIVKLAGMGMPLVCPIRHPLRLYESHKHRSASETHLQRMLDAWHDCLERIFPHAMLLPVDADELTRRRHHKAIERELGEELPVDWRKLVNSKPPGRAHMPLAESRAPEP